MKRFTGITSRQIGELFADLSYSAVAKAYQRLSTKLRNDKSLRKTVEDIAGNLSSVNRLTPSTAFTAFTIHH